MTLAPEDMDMLKTLMWATVSVIAIVATTENLTGADGTKADTWAKQIAEKDPRNANWRALEARKMSVGLMGVGLVWQT